MKKLIKSSIVRNLAFTCPKCGNRCLSCVDHDVVRIADVDYGDKFVCEECGAELTARPEYSGDITFEDLVEECKGIQADISDRPKFHYGELKEYLVKFVENNGYRSQDVVTAYNADDAIEIIKEENDVKRIISVYVDTGSTWDYVESSCKETVTGSSKIASSKENADFKTDRRFAPTNIRYRGYLIALDRGGDGYNIYDKHRELEDSGYGSLDAAKKAVDEIILEACSDITASEDIDLSEYDYVSNVDGYFIYRKVVDQSNGSKKGVWVAQDQDEKNPPFSITYDQARGFDPINDTSGIKKLGKQLGKKLLTNSVEASDDATKNSRYSEHFVYSRSNTKFSIYTNDYDEDDPDDFICQISEIHLYDLANYTWAVKTTPVEVLFYKKNSRGYNQMVGSMNVPEWDADNYEDGTEYVNDVIDRVCVELIHRNADVEPKIDHT